MKLAIGILLMVAGIVWMISLNWTIKVHVEAGDYTRWQLVRLFPYWNYLIPFLMASCGWIISVQGSREGLGRRLRTH